MSIYSEIPLDKFPEMVEVFLDPDNEVFFGPITEKEREISKLLPRRTLDPNEIDEIRRKGMTYLQWETQEENMLEERYLDHGSDSNTDGDISLNDTWEIQEKMLAFAEKLEKGEDIPELGIYQISSKNREEEKKHSREEFVVHAETNQLASLEKSLNEVEDNPIAICGTRIETSKTDIYDCFSEVLTSSWFIPETPSRGITGYRRLTPFEMNSSRKTNKKQMCALRPLKCKTIGVPSPIGMYIRSVPEPILIENIRLTSKKQIITETIDNYEERKIEKNNIQKTGEIEDITPVLPAVLHMAAPPIHIDGVQELQTSVPAWYRGKIGRLLERNATPTVFKHKGRVHVSKHTVNSARTPQIVQSSKPHQSENRQESCKLSVLDISVLENVTKNPFTRTFKK